MVSICTKQAILAVGVSVLMVGVGWIATPDKARAQSNEVPVLLRDARERATLPGRCRRLPLGPGRRHGILCARVSERDLHNAIGGVSEGSPCSFYILPAGQPVPGKVVITPLAGAPQQCRCVMP